MLYAILALVAAGGAGWLWALWQRGSDKSQAVDLANARAQCAQLVSQLTDCRQKLQDQIKQTNRLSTSNEQLNDALNATEAKLGEHLGADGARDWMASLLSSGTKAGGGSSMPN